MVWPVLQSGLSSLRKVQDTVWCGPCRIHPGLDPVPDVGPGPRWTRHVNIKRIFASVSGSYTQEFPFFDRGPQYSSLQPDSIELGVVRDRKFEP